mgnify:CR=1 FL=1
MKDYSKLSYDDLMREYEYLMLDIENAQGQIAFNSAVFKLMMTINAKVDKLHSEIRDSLDK